MNIHIFTDEKEIDNSSTAYVRQNLQDTYNVTVSTDGNTRPARKADVVFIRKDNPTAQNPDFLDELIALQEGRLMINNPETIKKWGTKDALMDYASLMPDTQIASSYEQAMRAIEQSGGSVILKPLDGQGGEGIMRILDNDSFYSNKVRNFAKANGDFMIQQYIPEIPTLGDQRSTIIFGEYVADALRLAAQGSYLCNVSAGGHVADGIRNKKVENIIDAMHPIAQQGGHWLGIDILGPQSQTPYLGEINVRNPGMVLGKDQQERQPNAPVMSALERGIHDFRNSHFFRDGKRISIPGLPPDIRKYNAA